jgi:hypothetical protein
MLKQDAVDAVRRLQDSSAAGVTEQLRWYVNRLRCMTQGEIHHRVLRALEMQAERLGLVGSVAVPPPDVARASRPWIRTGSKAKSLCAPKSPADPTGLRPTLQPRRESWLSRTRIPGKF